MNHSVLIIGGGNMGGAVAKALHQAEGFTVRVVETDAARRAAFAVLGIPAHETLAQTDASDITLLAIKPQQFAGMVGALQAHLPRTTLLVSIMAGISLAALSAVAENVVRVMPNLPAMIGESMSVACAPTLDVSRRELGTQMLASIGAVAWVEEEAQLHAVTAISGSGSGYVFAFMEALQQAAIAQGLPVALARQLVNQTFRGAALLADQSPEDAATLRAQVTSKGGTTEAALQQFAEGNFSELVARAARAAAEKSKTLAGE